MCVNDVQMEATRSLTVPEVSASPMQEIVYRAPTLNPLTVRSHTALSPPPSLCISMA